MHGMKDTIQKQTEAQFSSDAVQAQIKALTAAQMKSDKVKELISDIRVTNRGRYDMRVIVDDIENVTEVQNAIGDMGFQTTSNTEWIAQQEQQSKSQQAMLGGIGAVSLLVAAIGIANTMMMSIYERTKEIGVMKVLGCGLFDIQQLFLIEAGIIGLFGGAIGLIISVIICAVINKVSGMQIAIIPPWMYPTSIAFAVLVSMGAGFAPSRRAMKLSALEAIRNN